MNNKSIASRFFTSISVLIMVSISLLVATFMAFANRYFESDRLNILNLCVESVEDNLAANYDSDISSIDDVAPVTENLKLISDTTKPIKLRFQVTEINIANTLQTGIDVLNQFFQIL